MMPPIDWRTGSTPGPSRSAAICSSAAGSGLHTLAHEVAHAFQSERAHGGDVIRRAPPAEPEPLPEVTIAWMSRMLAGSLGVPASDAAVLAQDLMTSMYTDASPGPVAMKPEDFDRTHPITVNGTQTHAAETSTRVARAGDAQKLSTSASGTRRIDKDRPTGSLLAHEQLHKDLAVFAVIQVNSLIAEMVADGAPLSAQEMQRAIAAAFEFKERWSRFYDSDPNVINRDMPANVRGTNHDPDSDAQLTYWNTGQWYVDAMKDWRDRREDVKRQIRP